MSEPRPDEPGNPRRADPASLEGKVTDEDMRIAGLVPGQRRGERFWVMNREGQKQNK